MRVLFKIFLPFAGPRSSTSMGKRPFCKRAARNSRKTGVFTPVFYVSLLRGLYVRMICVCNL